MERSLARISAMFFPFELLRSFGEFGELEVALERPA
jgi:hypothetical protein